MNDPDTQRELLLRRLDGRASAAQQASVDAWLRADRAARDFLREVAEQSVMVADLERSAAARHAAQLPRPEGADGGDARRRPRRWRWGVAAAAAILLLVLAVIKLLPNQGPAGVRVARVSGSSLLVGSGGAAEVTLDAGALLRAGDTLETRSCDAWIELALDDGSRLTIGGHSMLRILDGKRSLSRFHLMRGTLWISPAQKRAIRDLVIETPALVVESRGVQLDAQASDTETLVRVNSGSARVRQQADGSVAEVPAGHQVIAPLGHRGPLAVLPQPEPTDRWACNLERVPQVLVGRWLPPDGAEVARLGAEPLLWPLPDREPVLLYAAALSVLSSTDRPVLLRQGSRLLFRGRTQRPQTVRFGFSTQRMQGVFSGKFEVDVRPESLGPAGEAWQVDLSLTDFRPLQPQLSFTPEGLELTDVYALTIREDAGLEINHIELAPPAGTTRP